MEDTPVKVPTFSEFFEIMQSWPLQTQVGIFMFAIIWMVGANIVFSMSLKRRGIPWWKSFIPSLNYFSGFNTKEWLAICVLGVVSMEFGVWGMLGQHQ